ncbi:MAG: hypothetical protein PHQ27_01280 [Victivallales bacterium]|nr:hypothetical protein [Victivallales bacterium]
MNEASDKSHPEAVGRRVRGKWWKKLLLSLLALVVALLVMVWGTRQSYRVPEVPEAWELAATQQVMNKLAGSLLDSQGNVAAEAVIRLTPEEVNALLRSWLRTEQAQQARDGKRPAVAAVWKDGALFLRVSQPLFLGAVNVRARVVPGFSDKKVALQVGDAWVGWLPLPSGLVTSGANRAVADLAKEEKFQAGMAIFDKISVTASGELELRIYPRNIGELMKLLF